MSSAALQSAPRQSATSIAALASPPLAAPSPSSSGRQHNQQATPSPGRDSYYAASQNSTSSPSSTQRPSSRKPNAANGNGHNGSRGDIPLQSNSPMSSRTALASPIPINTTYDRPPSSDRRTKNMPSATVPTRSSSSQHAPSGSSSRKQQSGERWASQRNPSGDTNGQANANQSYSEDASRSRRSEKPGNNQRDGSQTSAPPVSMPNRSQRSASSTPQGPSREASEILNSVLVSPPEVDIARERERAALSQPHPGAMDEVPTPGEQQGEEPRRGTRSRHDFSKREKHTKFGEYILGNTIGEGEFGKVKLGWKQEGGVQVGWLLFDLHFPLFLTGPVWR